MYFYYKYIIQENMKKTIISLLLVAVLAFGAGFGTLAYYTDTFKSEVNTITTAKFNPEKGSNQWSTTAIIDGQTFAPGKDISLSYAIDLKETEVPIKYIIKVNTENLGLVEGDNNGIFSEGSPIQQELSVYDSQTKETTVLNKMSDGTYEFVPEGRRAVFFIKYKWPFETVINDVRIEDELYAGKKGKLDLSIEVKQIREEESKLTDGKQFVKVFGANDGYYAEITFNQPIAKKLKSMTFIAFDANNKRIASSSANTQILESINNGYASPYGNAFMAYDGSIVTVRPSTGPWSTNKYLDAKPANIKAIFEFENDSNIYYVEYKYN